MEEAFVDLESIINNNLNLEKLSATQHTFLKSILNRMSLVVHSEKIKELKKQDSMRGLSENSADKILENLNDAFRNTLSHKNLLRIKGIDFVKNVRYYKNNFD